MFAVKIVDFGTADDFDTLNRRERYETEKYIMTSVNHPNVVTVRNIINMGEQQPYPYTDTPENTYLSPERIYIFMDFAEGGSLTGYIDCSVQPYIKIQFIRQLFAGK